ncbi:MAG: class I SAM-dependent RNA methyltransferase [Clostridiales Family XIII bacterium]|jgi:putative N6-adenine-specific DNA methylase|nr:class I SAM-dependent RNA methyltransferase [Clostridiales Family XIII bacterium]
MKLELVATATFGLEAVVRREIEGLGFKVTGREDGRITYIANEAGLVRSNLWLRTADRVLIKLGEFKALAFEDLFQGMRAIPWETLIPEDGNFTVGATSVKSQLSSVPACQSVAEKGLIARLSETYGEQRFSKSGAGYEIRIRILKDICAVTVDTSGPGLHKRGYRTANVEAPIKETLAAALVSLSFWKAGRLLVDPFCGSGTIAIEAALMGRGIAPGLNRGFAAESWAFIPQGIWKQERSEAYKKIDLAADIRVEASDISEKAIAAARANAENAGVGDCIGFSAKSFESFAQDAAGRQGGVMVCNPPYGERIGEKQQLDKTYREIGAFFRANKSWSLFLITSDKDFERAAMGRPADRRRKLYNGRIETTYYQYHGTKPARAVSGSEAED